MDELPSDERNQEGSATAGAETPAESPQPVSAARIVMAIAMMALAVAAILLVPAGRLDWTLGWLYVGLLIGNVVIMWQVLARFNPVLIERRMRFGKGTKDWDKVWAVLFTPVMIAIYIVAGLEVQDGVSNLPIATWPLGLAILVLGTAMFTWSMIVNPFFEKTVRIQTEHGHHVIDTGPYAYVRHPGYVGFISWILSAPLLLASAWAFIPAVLAVLGVIIRTALEDRTLRAELPGYAEYSERVRFRLIPGVW